MMPSDVRRSVTHGSTAGSRRDIVTGIRNRVVAALEDRPEDVTGVLVVVTRRERGETKALRIGTAWGGQAVRELATVAGEVLDGLARGMTTPPPSTRH